jgi:hypothetical protein
VPLIVIVFDTSKMENEWCASTGQSKMTVAIPIDTKYHSCTRDLAPKRFPDPTKLEALSSAPFPITMQLPRNTDGRLSPAGRLSSNRMRAIHSSQLISESPFL